MGVVPTIDAYHFPKQTAYVNRRVQVFFKYDTKVYVNGTIIRDDSEEPGETIIKLDDGRVIRGSECQFTPFAPARVGE